MNDDQKETRMWIKAGDILINSNHVTYLSMDSKTEDSGVITQLVARVVGTADPIVLAVAPDFSHPDHLKEYKRLRGHIESIAEGIEEEWPIYTFGKGRIDERNL